jgi:hypothetical protein
MLLCGVEPIALSIGECGPELAVSFPVPFPVSFPFPEDVFLLLAVVVVVVLVDFLSLVVWFGLSVVDFFGTCGESAGVSRGEVPLVVLLDELLRSDSGPIPCPAPSSAVGRRGGGSETEEVEEEEAWSVIESATTGESSERHMSSSW